jgi:hypothetical protein
MISDIDVKKIITDFNVSKYNKLSVVVDDYNNLFILYRLLVSMV